jgi:hypothetical protein
MGFHRGPKIVTDGLVLYLDAANTRSYPGTGTTWNDLSGNGHIATAVGEVSFLNTNNGIFRFTGNGNFNTTYTQPIYTSSTNFTWNVWVYPRVNSNNQLILGNRQSNPSELQFTKLTTLQMEFYPNNVSVTAPLNIWQNITIVKNGTSMTYYRNGISFISWGPTTDKTVTNPFFIGGDAIAGERANADISLVQVYDRALTPQEILQNYNATKSRYGL